METHWFVETILANRLVEPPLINYYSVYQRHAQTLPYDRHLGVHEKPRLRAFECRTHTDPWHLEKARDSL